LQYCSLLLKAESSESDKALSRSRWRFQGGHIQAPRAYASRSPAEAEATEPSYVCPSDEAERERARRFCCQILNTHLPPISSPAGYKMLLALLFASFTTTVALAVRPFAVSCLPRAQYSRLIHLTKSHRQTTRSSSARAASTSNRLRSRLPSEVS
jgi:hypothetical protein